MRITFIFIGLIAALFFVSCENANPVLLTNTHPQIKYKGRIDSLNNATNLYWPGTSIKLNFQADSIFAFLWVI